MPYLRKVKPEETIDFQLKTTWQAVARMYNELASAYGSTMVTGYVLLNIDAEGSPSTSLGPKMGLEPTGLSRSLKQLEDRGLIARKKHRADGRIVMIHLTPEGLVFRDKARQAVLEFNERVRLQLPPQEWDRFFSMMSTIRKIAESAPALTPQNS